MSEERRLMKGNEAIAEAADERNLPRPVSQADSTTSSALSGMRRIMPALR